MPAPSATPGGRAQEKSGSAPKGQPPRATIPDTPTRPAPTPAPEPAPKPPAQQVARSQQDIDEATQARRAAADARQEALKAQAPRLAGATLTAADQKQADGDALLGRNDPASARLRFQEAQQTYRQAAQQAVAALRREQTDAEQAQSQMASARRAAEQAADAKYALSALNAGRAKEREALAAFGRAEYGPAAKLFRDALGEYQDAKKEAEKERGIAAERQQIAALKADTDQSRRVAIPLRDFAVKAEADRLAKALFDAAAAKQAEAEALAGRESFAAATQAYKDAAERYRQAAARAGIVRQLRAQADSAREKMIAEKQRARQGNPDFLSGQAEEGKAVALYERLDYQEAIEKFKAAETLYAKAAVPAPAPPSGRSAPTPPARPRPLPPSF